MEGYYAPLVTQRDMECRAADHAEMLAMQRAFRRAEKCEVCGAKKTNTMRHGDEIVVSCKSCVGKTPTTERRAINNRLAEMRSMLAKAERLIGT
jgi:hypothetical protein